MQAGQRKSDGRKRFIEDQAFLAQALRVRGGRVVPGRSFLLGEARQSRLHFEGSVRHGRAPRIRGLHLHAPQDVQEVVQVEPELVRLEPEDSRRWSRQLPESGRGELGRTDDDGECPEPSHLCIRRGREMPVSAALIRLREEGI